MLTGVDIPPSARSQQMGRSQSHYYLQYLLTGWPFALSMMGILFTHEMGHYIACRIYKVPATLPFFLPAPFISPLGTLGAFIMMRGIPKNKRVFVRCGCSRSHCGTCCRHPCFVYWIIPIASRPDWTRSLRLIWFSGGQFIVLFVFQILWCLANYSPSLPALADFHQRFIGCDISLRVIRSRLAAWMYKSIIVALAGWAGLLVTALNLVPVGTLDGGHVAYGLFGEKARRIFPDCHWRVDRVDLSCPFS